MSNADTLLRNQLHIIGETKYKEFQVINNFWKQQHEFIKDWQNAYKQMNDVFTKEAQIIESTFYSKSAGFIPEDGETIMTSLSYIGNITQLLCNRVVRLFNGVLDSLDMKFKDIEEAFKSAGYTDKKGKQKDVVNETIVASLHSLTQNASVTITKMVTDFIGQYENFFRMGISFIEESEQFKQMKDNITIQSQEMEKMNATKHFVQYANVSLKKILEEEHRTENDLPRVIEDFNTIILKKGINTKGIFRETTATNKMIEEVYLRMSVTNFEEFDPAAVAAVYKRFLRGIPNQIFHEEQCQLLSLKVRINQMNTQENIKAISEIFETLSVPKKILFTQLLKVLTKIVQNEKVNSMSSKNLAVCLTPSIFQIGESEVSQMMLPKLIDIMKFMTDNFNLLFPKHSENFFHSKDSFQKKHSDDSKKMNFLQRREPTAVKDQSNQTESNPIVLSAAPFGSANASLKGSLRNSGNSSGFTGFSGVQKDKEEGNERKGFLQTRTPEKGEVTQRRAGVGLGLKRKVAQTQITPEEENENN